MSDKTEYIELECCNCKKKFQKTLHRYKEAVKCGYDFFCSRECANQFKTTNLTLKCLTCNEDIFVARHAFNKSENKHFFCSSACSAKFTNKARGQRTDDTKQNIYNGLKRYYEKNGLKMRGKRQCLVCNKTFSPKTDKCVCCSQNCATIYRFGSLPYTKDDVVNTIININRTSGLTPQKRVVSSKLYFSAVKFFGTWNDAMKSCGLVPNKQLRRKSRLLCKDGHVVDSLSEKIIDEWLFKNRITHEKNKKYPDSRMTCDFYFTEHRLWVEYFGLCRNKRSEYDDAVDTKKKIVSGYGLNFVALYPKDLYDETTKETCDDRLKKIFGKYIRV